MYELKRISVHAVPEALERAERYRLLNEPAEAESICLDILESDPNNREATIVLLLALTDQFSDRMKGAYAEARAVLEKLDDEYQQDYYRGVICERRARAHLRSKAVGSGFVAYDWFQRAMESYERAEQKRPEGNDEAILRWNTCARALMRNPELRPSPETAEHHMLE